MSASKHIRVLVMTAALAVGQSAVAQEPAGDSAYQWGRWAVLSPAAGGEPFRAPDEPGADFNVRPGELYGPEVVSLGAPPVSPPSIGDFPGGPIGNLPLPPPPPPRIDDNPGGTIGNLPLPPPPP